MDRRSRLGFQPETDSLEARRLMATSAGSAGAAAVNGTNPNANPTTNNNQVPLANLQQKLNRIERLPAFLRSLDRDRPIPEDLAARIQSDLTSLKGKLTPPPRTSLVGFNMLLADTLGSGSLSMADASRLNGAFGRILAQAGAPTGSIVGLQTSLNQLSESAVEFTGSPTNLVANDYALVLQTALAVGRPLPAPGPARLVTADDSGVRGDFKTSATQPRLSGQYDPGTALQLVDSNGQVIGSATTNRNGAYVLAPSTPLSVGKHVLIVRAIDPEGAVSLPSRPINLTILGPATPRGPVGLRSGASHR